MGAIVCKAFHLSAQDAGKGTATTLINKDVPAVTRFLVRENDTVSSIFDVTLSIYSLSHFVGVSAMSIAIPTISRLSFEPAFRTKANLVL